MRRRRRFHRSPVAPDLSIELPAPRAWARSGARTPVTPAAAPARAKRVVIPPRLELEGPPEPRAALPVVPPPMGPQLLRVVRIPPLITDADVACLLSAIECVTPGEPGAPEPHDPHQPPAPLEPSEPVGPPEPHEPTEPLVPTLGPALGSPGLELGYDDEPTQFAQLADFLPPGVVLAVEPFDEPTHPNLPRVVFELPLAHDDPTLVVALAPDLGPPAALHLPVVAIEADAVEPAAPAVEPVGPTPELPGQQPSFPDPAPFPPPQPSPTEPVPATPTPTPIDPTQPAQPEREPEILPIIPVVDPPAQPRQPTDPTTPGPQIDPDEPAVPSVPQTPVTDPRPMMAA